MTASITFFPVGNGDMTLVRLADQPGTSIMIDINIRVAADDPTEDIRDVAADLRERLPRDEKGRPYVDAFLMSHPDKDHCTGLQTHFHLGPLADYADDTKPDAQKKIVIREMWSSPIVFRRASKNHVLCSDAKAFRREAKRRVGQFLTGVVSEGDRILIMGEDKGGKTDQLTSILVRSGEVFSTINGLHNAYFSARLLAPLLICDDDDEVALLTKNHSSVILNFQIASSATRLDSCRFLTAGDAEVAIWERLWKRYKDTPEVLEYDLLETPHHCSWHVMSHDSWSVNKEQARVSQDARSALGQARFGAMIVASCNPIKDDDCDPPCIRAKREYKAILDAVSGTFICTGETPQTWAPAPLDIEITTAGPKRQAVKISGVAAVAAAAAPRAGCQ